MGTKQCKICMNLFDITSFRMRKKWRGNICRMCRNAQRKERYHSIEKKDDSYIKNNRNRAKKWFNDNTKKHADTCRDWRNSTDKGYWTNKITSIKANCRIRGMDCSISRIDLENIYNKQNGKCPLTGRDLIKSRKKSKLDTCSVDRIDNNIGYVIGNIRLITLQSNIAKSTGTDEDLLNFCKDIIAHNKKTP